MKTNKKITLPRKKTKPDEQLLEDKDTGSKGHGA